jgi:hypothetical protein
MWINPTIFSTVAIAISLIAVYLVWKRRDLAPAHRPVGLLRLLARLVQDLEGNFEEPLTGVHRGNIITSFFSEEAEFSRACFLAHSPDSAFDLFANFPR